ncbi:hypothetical protein [Brachybacterium sp. GPGPB12]|uniref:hypothetical protein n=1 Tax=Brachybacterium sp. GPGPB12 TaxID=3023517 RepID=UPI0031344EBB
MSNLASTYARTMYRDIAKPWATNPVWANGLRDAISPSWTTQAAACSATTLAKSFHRDLFRRSTPGSTSARSSLPPQLNHASAITPTLPSMDFLRPSTAVLTALTKSMGTRWVPPHDLFPGLTGVPLPGLDDTVRSILREISTQYELDIDAPDEEIEFTDLPDIELQPDLEFALYIDDLSGTLQSAFIPREVSRRGVRNLIFALCVIAFAQNHAPEILHEPPPGVEQSVEEVWPDWAHLPEWMVQAILLGTGIAGLDSLSSRGSDSRRDEENRSDP